ncbi:MAG: tRNA (adenosine(37)-N6)-threonylcarbamoyltransferase complex transferase subunit TsaD [Planctomycetota bacterium]
MDRQLILTIETTCDETAAAVIADDLEVLSSVVASQEELHLRFSGVVPEIAARAHVQRILPVIDETLRKAGVAPDDLSAIAVANTPGLSGSLLVGVSAAKAFALAAGKPLVAVNHLHAHVYACQLENKSPVYPCIGMIVSGGHTHLYRYENPLNAEFLGGTIDDAAGEAFDKVASMLGLGYPGGPAVSKVAADGDPKAFRFPRSFIKEDRLDFSFSGLKTAVRYAIAGPGKTDISSIKLSEQQIADLAASFQIAVVDCLVAKAVQAVEQTGLRTLCVGGGVAANRLFRGSLESECESRGIDLNFAPMKYCTDNAVMGAIAFERIKAGIFEELDLDISPGLVRHGT